MTHHDSDANHEGAGFYINNSPYASRFSRFSRPLIDTVRNGWQSHSDLAYHSQQYSSPSGNKNQGYAQVAMSVVSAPRFRRYVLIYLTLFLLGWAGWTFLLYPRLQERAHLLQSLDPTLDIRAGGWFGTNSVPKFDGLTLIETLDPSLVPGAPSKMKHAGSRRRLVIVGDVHGCKEECGSTWLGEKDVLTDDTSLVLKLLGEVSFSREHGDHLVLTGDIINKGPDSGGVVDLARELQASCVRGNHEDRILLHRKNIQQREKAALNGVVGAEVGDKEFFSAKELGERELARSFSEEQTQWLNACPVILRVGQIPGMGQVVVVHGGLMPGVELEKQDPPTVMTMRTIDIDTHVPSSSSKGLKWSKVRLLFAITQSIPRANRFRYLTSINPIHTQI